MLLVIGTIRLPPEKLDLASPHLAEWRAAWAGLGVTDRNLVRYQVGDPTAT